MTRNRFRRPRCYRTFYRLLMPVRVRRPSPAKSPAPIASAVTRTPVTSASTQQYGLILSLLLPRTNEAHKRIAVSLTPCTPQSYATVPTDVSANSLVLSRFSPLSAVKFCYVYVVKSDDARGGGAHKIEPGETKMCAMGEDSYTLPCLNFFLSIGRGSISRNFRRVF